MEGEGRREGREGAEGGVLVRQRPLRTTSVLVRTRSRREEGGTRECSMLYLGHDISTIKKRGWANHRVASGEQPREAAGSGKRLDALNLVAFLSEFVESTRKLKRPRPSLSAPSGAGDPLHLPPRAFEEVCRSD